MKRITILFFCVVIFTVLSCGNYIGDALNPSVSFFSTSSNTFTTVRMKHQSVVYNGYLYIIGGYNQDVSFLNDIQYAEIRADGSLGVFITSTNTFTGTRAGHSSVVYNGYLYVIGGSFGPGSYYNDVQYAKINADGSLESFTTSPNTFTDGRMGHTSVVYNDGYLYVIGGGQPGVIYHDTVQYAKISPDGSINAFTTSPNTFTDARMDHTSVVCNDYVYVIGGHNDIIEALSDIQYAPLNSDGSIGAFIAAGTVLSPGRKQHGSIVYNDYLYISCGYDGSESLGSIQYARINTDGSIGSFTVSSRVVSPARSGHSSVEHNGFLYIIGGGNVDGALNDIKYARIY
jgi:hypothetical protein